MMLPEIEETQTELLRRVATGDRDALGGFYDQTATPLYSLAFRMLGNAGDAEEVIQDVFMLIWTKAGMYDPAKGRAFEWALSLTRHRCIDRLRARQRRARVIVEVDGDAEPGQAADTAPAEGALQKHELVAVHSAVKALPPEQRRAIELAFFDGHTYQEIAGLLNEPLGTIKARIRRGMLKLRGELEDYL